MSDGAEHASTFSGKLEQEYCFELELTCGPRKSDRALESVKAAIANSRLNWDVDTNWIHVTEIVVAGRHVNIAATAAEPDRSLAVA